MTGRPSSAAPGSTGGVPGGAPLAWGDEFRPTIARDAVAFVCGAVLRRPALAAACLLSVVALSLLGLWAMPARYGVEAIVLAQPSTLVGTLSNPGLARDWDRPVQMAREAILGHDALVAISRRARFSERRLEGRAPLPRLVSALRRALRGSRTTEGDELEIAVEILEARLWVGSAPGAGLVTIGFEWSDRQVARDVVAAAVDTFLEARRKAEVGALEESLAVLEGAAARLQTEIEQASQSLHGAQSRLLRRPPLHRRATRPAEPAQPSEPADPEARLDAARRTLAELEELRARQRSELEARLSQMVNVYAPEHPSVREARRALERLSAPLPRVEALRAEVRELEDALGRARREPGHAGQTSVAEVGARAAGAPREDEDARADAAWIRLRSLLAQDEQLQQRIDSVRLERESSDAAFRFRYTVIRPPLLPDQPVRPRPGPVVGGALVGGIACALFACTLVALAERRRAGAMGPGGAPWQ